MRQSSSRRKRLQTSKSSCQVCGKDYHNAHGLARQLREDHAENRYLFQLLTRETNFWYELVLCKCVDKQFFINVFLLLNTRYFSQLATKVTTAMLCCHIVATKVTTGRIWLDTADLKSSQATFSAKFLTAYSSRYECPLCGHFFPVRHSLERHIRNVHHPVKHECPYCGVAVIHLVTTSFKVY